MSAPEAALRRLRERLGHLPLFGSNATVGSTRLTLTLVVVLLTIPLGGPARAARKKPRFKVTTLHLWDDGVIPQDSGVFSGAPIDLDRDGDLDYIAFITPDDAAIGGEGEVDPVPALFLRNDDGTWVEDSKKHLKKVRAVNAVSVLVGDFNRDGRSDVYVADSGSDNDPFHGAPNLLAFGAGRAKLKQHNRGFATNPSVFTNSATFADADGDGSLDIFEGNVIFGLSQTPARLLFNDGKGNFSERDGALPDLIDDPLTSPVDENWQFVRFVDVDADGDPDLVIGGGVQDHLLRNDGGVFTDVPGALPARNSRPTYELASGNLNGDEWPDLVWNSDRGDGVSRAVVYLNRGDGTFEVGRSSWIPKAFQSGLNHFTLVDLDGDGLDDFLAQDFPDTTLVLLNRRGKRFRRLKKPFIEDSVPLTGNCCARAEGAADYDGDGDVDLVYLDGNRFFYADNLMIDR